MSSKIFFFHYIRKYSKAYQYFNFLHENNFKKIIKANKKKLIKIGENIDNLIYKKKNIFSFDDGLKDHLFASKILNQNNIMGLFFINTQPIIEKKILDVHKLHLLFGKYKSSEIINQINKYENLNLRKIEVPKFKKYQLTNSFDNDHLEKLKLKIFFNYKKKNKYLLNKIFNYFFSHKNQKKILENFYLNPNDIKKIDKRGMLIGGHSHSHKLLSKLSFTEQNKEIKKNIYYLSKILNKKIIYFASPWGYKKSYNSTTIKILKNSVNYHFTTLPLNKKKNNYEIPRINCNKIKNGNIFNYRKKNDI